MSALFNPSPQHQKQYQHFASLIIPFYQMHRSYRLASVNNQALDLNRLSDCRISRFIRDPRDLVVSGYFYHKKGAEAWSTIVNPTEADFQVVNGNRPNGMGKDQSFSTYLSSLDVDDGLIAEIDFRKNGFDSMLDWPMEDPRIKLFRYEDTINNETSIFSELFSFYGLSGDEFVRALELVELYSAKSQTGKMTHIRNPESGQWRKYFTPRVLEYFMDRHAKIIEKYHYD
jgi:hypothetical protein